MFSFELCEFVVMRFLTVFLMLEKSFVGGMVQAAVCPGPIEQVSLGCEVRFVCLFFCFDFLFFGIEGSGVEVVFVSA